MPIVLDQRHDRSRSRHRDRHWDKEPDSEPGLDKESTRTGGEETPEHFGRDEQEWQTPVKEAKTRNDSKEDYNVDEEGNHIPWRPNDKIDQNDRYTVIKQLGQGTFGCVLECFDSKHKANIAMKIIYGDRADGCGRRYCENGKIEAGILDVVRSKESNDLKGKDRCIRFCRAFSWNGNYCMVFEVCGTSIFEFLKNNQYRRYRTMDVLLVVQQTLQCLRFLHNELNLVHTDLKLENILFVDDKWYHDASRSKSFKRPLDASIKIIDFGNGVWLDKEQRGRIQTNNYRAPEVTLGMPWDGKSDVWSVGACAIEMLTGELLFEPKEDGDFLAQIETACGEGSLDTILNRKGTEHAKGTENARERTRHDNEDAIDWMRERDDGTWRLQGRCYNDRAVRQKPLSQLMNMCDADIQDLIKCMLIPDPHERPSAAVLLKHRAFSFLDKKHHEYEYEEYTEVVDGVEVSGVRAICY